MRWILIFIVVSFNFGWLYAQPGGDFPSNINIIYFRTDTNVKVNNNFLVRGKQVIPRCDTCKTYLFYRSYFSKSKGHWYSIPIIDSNNFSLFWPRYPFRSDIDSVYKDSIYCNLQLQLIKDKDTMNILVKNIFYKPTCTSERYNFTCTAYYIKYIPFKKGNFKINVSNPNKAGNYRNIYDRVLQERSWYNYWNITPENWEKLRVKK